MCVGVVSFQILEVPSSSAIPPQKLWSASLFAEPSVLETIPAAASGGVARRDATTDTIVVPVAGPLFLESEYEVDKFLAVDAAASPQEAGRDASRGAGKRLFNGEEAAADAAPVPCCFAFSEADAAMGVVARSGSPPVA